MYSASSTFLTAVKSTVRQLYGRVTIDYTNSNIDASIEVTANETANLNHASQVANGIESMGYKYAAFDGTWELGADWALAPGVNDTEEFGWWSNTLSGVAGAFSVPYPLLTVTFFSRPIRSLKVAADDKRNEYPIHFEIKLYQAGSVLAHTETVTANTTVLWNADIVQVNSVVKMTLEIYQWSEATRNAKVVEFYSSIQETYEGDDIIDFSLVEEREVSQGTLPIGNISANEIEIKLNNIDNKFDAGNTTSELFELLKPYRRIRAWIGCKLPDTSIEYVPLGTFWSGDWETPETEIYASTSGRDLMERMRKTTYSTSIVQQNVTLYALAEDVLTDYGLTAAEYEIDTELQSYTIPYAWFASVSHREALRLIVEACMGSAYIDRNGVLQVQGPSFLDSIVSAQLTITLDDIWSKSNPVKWSEIANYIEVTASPLMVASVAEQVYASTDAVTLSASGTTTITAYYSVIPCISAVATISAGLTATTTITAATYYSWGADITIANAAITSDTFNLFINAKPLTSSNNTKIVSQDSDSIIDNGKLTYTVPDNHLIQTATMAQTIADTILSVFKDPRRDITIGWRGNPALELTDRTTAPDYKDISTADYFTIKQTLDFDGTLIASISGRKAAT